MNIDIVMSYLHDLTLLAQVHCLLGQAVSIATARFYLHKDQVFLVLSHQIDLTIATTKIAFQNSISYTEQFFRRQTFAQATQTLSCSRINSSALISCIYQAPLLSL
jgi:hypothetical protein